MKNRRWLKLLLVLFAVVVLGVVFSVSLKKEDSDEQETSDIIVTDTTDGATIADVMTDDTDETKSETQQILEICVHVCGEVVNPDVYYLAEGSRIHEAVTLAGGLTEDADANCINLAKVVSDGEQIYIPSKEEVADGSFSVKTDSSGAGSDDGLVNINTAELSELTKLPGIGEAKAQAIIAYRDEAGGFTTIEELKNVSGIGDSLYEQVKDKIKT